jgi:transcriptional regulator with XRE-family HTH domain
MANTFPDQMRRAIKNSGMSLYAIAKITGIQRPQLSRFMSGERGLSIEGITEICKLLGLKLVGSARKPAGKSRKAKRKK